MKANLKDLLHDVGMTQNEAARLLGVHPAQLTRWAKNRVPAERVPEVERVTGIPRQDLRPDIYGSTP